ncbi:MAG TPA: tripartite tricarboxylate transporter TctB family protein [Burkholderiaceae bacterium]|jgi:putative tricarboxylic transport membrane protein|nr:tripartite tricarboxylate transporter TctB family protein [Burkholderiaceae bacterium]
MAPAGGARTELVLSAGVLALGAFALFTALRLPSAGGYSGIGPNAIPIAVAGGLAVLGVWLLIEALTGGWRARTSDNPAERGEHAFHTPAFAWVTVGLFAQMGLMHNAGFVLAAAVLFTCVARGFGSAKPVRDAAIGLALGLAVFLFFVKFLNVGLPGGVLSPVLGGAGI